MPDRINIGRMDRYLIVQSKTETKSAKGQVVATWTDTFRIFASQTDAIVSESFSALATVAPVTTSFSTYARPDLNRTQRLIQGTDTWNIISITTDGIFMKLECQRMDD